MNVIEHVRKRVLKISQAELGAIAGVSQGTVSKWENGDLAPDQTELSRIRSEVKGRGLKWKDAWVFEVPEAAE